MNVSKTPCYLIIFLLSSITLTYSQAVNIGQAKDTVIAFEYLKRAKQYKNAALLDSADIYYKKSLKIYLNTKKQLKVIVCYLGLADILIKKTKYDSAMDSLNKALILASSEKEKNEIIISDIYNLQGNAKLFDGKTDEAMVYYKNALSIRKKNLSANSLKIADSYHNIGNIYYYKGNSDQALIEYNKALAIRLKTLGENHKRVAQTYNNIGVIYRNKNEYDKALHSYIKAYKIFKKVLGEKHPSLSLNLNNIGDIYTYKGQYDEALFYYNKALKIATVVFGEIHLSVAQSLENIAVVYFYKGYLDRALEYELRVKVIRERLLRANHKDHAQTYTILGAIYHEKKDFDHAIAILKKGLQFLYNDSGNPITSPYLIYNNIATNYYDKKDYTKALKYYKKAKKACQKSRGDINPAMATIFNNIGLIYSDLGLYDSALVLIEKSLEMRKKLFKNDHPDMAFENYANIGTIFQRKKNLGKALKYFNIGINLALKLKEKNAGLAELYIKVSDIERHQGNEDRALSSIQKALDILNSIPKVELSPDMDFSFSMNKRLMLRALMGRVEILNHSYIKTKKTEYVNYAYSTVKLALKLLERLQVGYSYESAKLTLAKESHKLYELAIRTVLYLNKIKKEKFYLKEAFKFSEKSRLNILRQSIQESKARRFSGIPDSILIKEKELRTDMAYYEIELQKAYSKPLQDTSKIKYLEDKSFTIRSSYEKILKSLEKNYPNYYNLKYQNKSVSVSQIQKVLAKDEVLLEYMMGDSILYLFSISTDNYIVRSIPIEENFRQDLKNLLSGVKKYDKTGVIQLAKRFYNKLIKPINAQIKTKKRIYIIPDDILSYLPFEILITDDKDNLNKITYLVEEKEILYHYSAGFMARKEKINLSTSGFLGIAPVFDEKKNATEYFKTIFDFFRSTDSTLIRSVSINGKTLLPLKYSAEEVLSIAKMFREKDNFTNVLLREKATERAFKQNITQKKIIHIATHGLINNDQPMLSGLVFAPPKNEKKDMEDGVLYSGETYNLNIDADLLVLSSCESGLGKLVKGEGVLSLTRGFFFSGVNNIIVSLWKVSDKRTSRLMTEFYKFLLQGYPYPSALRYAKMKMLSNPIDSFPRNWAGFILLGQ